MVADSEINKIQRDDPKSHKLVLIPHIKPVGAEARV